MRILPSDPLHTIRFVCWLPLTHGKQFRQRRKHVFFHSLNSVWKSLKNKFIYFTFILCRGITHRNLWCNDNAKIRLLVQGWEIVQVDSFSLFVVSIMPHLAFDFTLAPNEEIDSGKNLLKRLQYSYFARKRDTELLQYWSNIVQVILHTQRTECIKSPSGSWSFSSLSFFI